MIQTLEIALALATSPAGSGLLDKVRAQHGSMSPEYVADEWVKACWSAALVLTVKDEAQRADDARRRDGAS